jgi:hypothetical protein
MKYLRNLIIAILIISGITSYAQELIIAHSDTMAIPISLLVPLKEIKIQLRNLNGGYLSAGEDVSFNAIDKPSGECETFSLYDLNGGELLSGDSIILKTCKGDYLFCDEKTNFSIVASDAPGSDVFTVIKAIGKGTMESNDGVLFRSSSGRVVFSSRCLQRQLIRDPEISCFEPVFIIIKVEDNETLNADGSAVKRSILPNGHVQLIYPDGTVLEKYPGGFTKITPDGRRLNASFVSAQPPTLPPTPPDQKEEQWLTWHSEYLLEFIKSLVGNDQESIQIYLDSEASLSTVYDKIAKRTSTINYLLTPSP